VILSVIVTAQSTAPGAPGQDAQWLSAGKQAIGTSANPESKVWFTLANGVLTEVMYPNVQTANVQMLQFVVVNPKTKKVETEWDDANHQIKALRPDSLSFQQINTAKSGQWKITKTYATDSKKNQLSISILFDVKDLALELYVYFDPSMNNSGMNDTSWTRQDVFAASDGDKFSALISNGGFTRMTNGFSGMSDGLTQLRQTGQLTTYIRAEKGNVVQFARLIPFGAVPAEVKKGNRIKRLINIYGLSLGFGGSEAEAISVARAGGSNRLVTGDQDYDTGWADFVKTLPKVDPRYQAQFNMAAMVVKALEDKTTRGGNVASLSVPWGGGGNGNEGGTGYRMVWSRDLYHVFTAFLAIGDKAAAERALDFLFKIQQKEDGSFPQNSSLNGKEGWGSLQMDEVGYPLIMAWQLGRFDKDTWSHVKKAADFIVAKGPFSPQERWEERPGYSPSTIAAQIAGLVCAADIAKRNGDNASAEIYLKTADNWVANVEKWTATTKGKYGDGNYYLRISEKGEPDGNHKIELNNNAGTFYEHEIVDAGFLELVRLGIKRADDPLIVKSLKVIDELIKIDTPSGPAFYRYNHDGYGEMDDGRKWNFDGKYTGRGRPWPLLSGERGQYEIALYQAMESARFQEKLKAVPIISTLGRPGPISRATAVKDRNLASAYGRLDHMLAFASESLMLPEQIWDKKTAPPNADRRFMPDLKFGKGTGSATPLAWSMGQFIRLAINLKAGRNLDTPQIVYDRYVRGVK
jgi:glucoamylase